MSSYLPTLSNDVSFSRYLREVQRFPSLSVQEEYELAKRFIEDKDISAAHKLVTSHLKLVAKIAWSYKGYGLPVTDLVSEGSIGLMQAVKKFDPELGNRLATYAMWWIRAAIQEYILRSWSLVKIGTTSAQKKLFNNLNKIKRRIFSIEARDINYDDIKSIASELGVNEREVNEMNSRMHTDISLNNYINADEGETEMLDMLPETRPNQEFMVLNNQENQIKRNILKSALSHLNPREQHIILKRKLEEKQVTLEDLSAKFNISRERVRQIEERAMEKLSTMVKASYNQQLTYNNS